MNQWFFAIFMVAVVGIFGTATSYAQIDDTVQTSEQVTLSDDLMSDPLALDLLKKIEQTKKWIAELEQKKYEENQAQKNLEEMRIKSLEILNQDLEEWERLWEKHTSRNAFETFVKKKPEYVQGVFWDQFEFKEQKVKAGREALKQVLLNGGSLKDARDAYNKAAETKRIELIEMNMQFNVNHKLAYYDQQMLFNSTGQFHPSEVTQLKLVQYYTDYRLDPAYLLANPNDDDASKYGSTNSNTECREGYVVVHRIKSDDYACITESTAQMWENSGIGEIVNRGKSHVFDENSLVPNIKTNPGTQCKEGHVVVYGISTSEYMCVTESTAKEMTSNGTGEFHDLLRYISGKDEYKIVLDKVYNINQEILKINQNYSLKQKNLNSEYDELIKNVEISIREDEKKLLTDYYSKTSMTKEDLAAQIMALRDTIESKKEEILKEKSRATTNLESELNDEMQSLVKQYQNNSEIQVIWNVDRLSYVAESR